MDIIKDKLPERAPSKARSCVAEEIPTKDYGGDAKRQASAVIFPIVAALAATVLLLSYEPTKTFIIGSLEASAVEYAERHAAVKASLAAVFVEAISLSDTTLIFFALLLLLPLSVVYRHAASLLLFLRVFVTSLGAGIVLLSGASVYGKIAVAIALTADAAASLYAAFGAVCTGDLIIKKIGTAKKHPWGKHLLKLIFAHGATVFTRFLLLAIGAFIL